MGLRWVRDEQQATWIHEDPINGAAARILVETGHDVLAPIVDVRSLDHFPRLRHGTAPQEAATA